MFLQKILVVIITLFSFALCCRSKLKPISKNKVIECIYKNVTEPQNHSYLVENGTTDYFFHKINVNFLLISIMTQENTKKMDTFLHQNTAKQKKDFRFNCKSHG